LAVDIHVGRRQEVDPGPEEYQHKEEISVDGSGMHHGERNEVETRRLLAGDKDAGEGWAFAT
jgi:hypothetical protein